MLGSLPLVYLLAVYAGSTVHGQGCSPGWFGHNCMFMCHCKLWVMCNTDGTCIGNTPCKTGYFGPHCQYVDLVQQHSTGDTANYLKDGDDTTCNSDENATEVRVALDTWFTFTWMRIHFIGHYGMDNFIVELNNGTAQCINARHFTVSNRTVDITCHVSDRVKTVTVMGSISPQVCSIYISGGRNVALKQATWMSSVFTPDPDGSASWKAVDGNTSPADVDKSCAKTGNSSLSEWRLTFDKLYIIYNIVLYSRDGDTDQLMNFTLETLDHNTTVFNFSDVGDQPRAIYTIRHNERSLVKSLRIVHLGSTVTICEVETYGDIACETNSFGLLCEETCNCSSTKVCHQHTGSCSEGCPGGYYGRNCTLECSKHCKYGVCSMDTGFCVSCEPGYTGDNCTTVCSQGTYGQDCMFNCSELCDNTCNVTNGICQCYDQYAGASCTGCVEGYFGSHCNKSCPLFCATCERSTGQCHKCLGNRVMPSCKKCPLTFFGDSCTSRCPGTCLHGLCHSDYGHCLECPQPFHGRFCQLKCPERCLNTTCHDISGNCFACQPGFQGDFCQEVMKTGHSEWVSVVLLAISVVINISFVISLVNYKKMERSIDNEEL